MVSLTSGMVESYRMNGFVHPVRVIDEETAANLRGAVVEHLQGELPSEAYELTDPIVIDVSETRDGRRLSYRTGGRTEPRTFPFLFNVWRVDERFRSVAFDPAIAAVARVLLDCDEVLLMEDNIIVKYPHTGALPWHQDLGYWPFTEPDALTVWIALDPMSPANGGMQLVPGSQRSSEALPVDFGTGAPLLGSERPGSPEVPSDPAGDGHPIVSYVLAPGEAGLHHPLVWHGSAPNSSESLRCAYALRYLRSGTVWWGHRRMPYDEIGCAVGDRVDGRHFPVV